MEFNRNPSRNQIVRVLKYTIHLLMRNGFINILKCTMEMYIPFPIKSRRSIFYWNSFLGRSRHIERETYPKAHLIETIERETYPKAHLIETLKEERASMRFWVDRGILRERPTQKRISLRLLRERPTQKRISLRL